MSTEIKKEIQLELAHVLFIDIVGYSKLPINEQRALVERLNETVRGAAEFQAAEAAGLALKNKYQMLQVQIYDAATRTRSMIEWPAPT